MFCENCGKHIDDDAKFCEYCGANINDDTTSTDKVTDTIAMSKKSKKKPIILAVVSAVILFIAAIVAYSDYEWVKEKRMSEEIDSHSIFNLDNESKPKDTTKPTVEITNQKVTTTSVTTTKTTTTKAKSDDKTYYSITFEADELIEEAGLQMGGHVGVAVLSNLTCSNGNANIETETIYEYDSLIRVEVTGAEAGEIVLGGTITTYGLDMFEGETVSYPVDSGVFLISKTVGEVSDDKPYVEGYVETYALSGRDGSKIRLYLDGDFSSVSVQIQNQEYTSEVEFYAKEDFGEYIEMNFNPGVHPPSVAYVTPYSDLGVAGDVITCDIPKEISGTIQSGGMSYPVDDMKGQINCHGGTVAGFTTDYVVNGRAVGKVRNSLGDTWHVTAKNKCDNYGVTWYELWDSDDGDYYGWVDSSYIDFY